MTQQQNIDDYDATEWERNEAAWIAFQNEQIAIESKICDDLQRTYDDNDDDDEQLTDGE